MKKVIIIRYAEMFLKGKNRGFFERVFSTNMERALRGFRHELHRYSGRYLVEDFEESETENIVALPEKGVRHSFDERRLRNGQRHGKYFRSGERGVQTERQF